MSDLEDFREKFVENLEKEAAREEIEGFYLVEVLEKFIVKVYRRDIRATLDLDGNFPVTVQDLTDFVTQDEEAFLEFATNEADTREIEWRLLLA